MYIPRHGVNFCLIRDGKILLQQRDAHCQRFPLAWCIPGGAQEPGEDYLETTLREIKEEYALELKPSDCEFIVDRPETNPGKVFYCRVPIDQDPELHEGEAMEWVDLAELPNRELGFNHQEIIVPFLLEFENKNKEATAEIHREWH